MLLFTSGPHQLKGKNWCRILSFGSTHLSSLSRQCTKIGNIPDFIRSSMGGLRSLDSSFLQGNGQKNQVTDLERSEKPGSCLIQLSPQKGSSAATGAGQERLPRAEFGNLQRSPELLLLGWEFLPKGFSPPPTDPQDLFLPLQVKIIPQSEITEPLEKQSHYIHWPFHSMLSALWKFITSQENKR